MNLSEQEILEKWEPKVHSMLRSTSIRGYDYEDIAQELRLSILRAYKKYDPTRGQAEFGTYLHVAMLNVIRGLINRSKKTPVILSLDKTYTDGPDNEYSKKMADIIEDPSQENEFDIIMLKDLEKTLNFTDDEKLFIKMRIEGYRLDEITSKMTSKKSAAKVRESIRNKIESYNR